MKPKISFNLDFVSPESGSLREVLSTLEADCTFENIYGLRPPLGIYNLSIDRISGKIVESAKLVRELIYKNSNISPEPTSDKHVDLIANHLESCIYAAAEHVDDLESCLLCLFENKKAFYKSTAVKEYKKKMKPLRDRIASLANTIKHNQGRVRIFRLVFTHDCKPTLLIGFFIEGVHDGVVGPSPILHRANNQIMSVPAFFWEVIFFIEHAADILLDAIAAMINVAPSKQNRDRFPTMIAALIETARLPNYNFDEEHPFQKTGIALHGKRFQSLFSDDEIYGSIGNDWSSSNHHQFGGMSLDYRGDGVSKSFKLVNPTQVAIQRWESR